MSEKVKADDVEPREPREPGESGVGRSIMPCRPDTVTPGGSMRVADEISLYSVTESGRAHPLMPATTPVTPATSHSHEKSSNSTDDNIFNVLNDSGSESDDSYEENFAKALQKSNYLEKVVTKLRSRLVEEEEKELSEIPGGSGQVAGGSSAAVDRNFIWSDDTKSFFGQKETYERLPGPTFDDLDPVSIFLKFWDREFMGRIAEETNKYAWRTIAFLSDPDIGKGVPKHLDSWTDVTVDELYRYFAIIILMTFCYRSKLFDYWRTDLIFMPSFRQLMSRNRFYEINRFLHFVDNDNLSKGGYAGKVEKIAPVLDHCNKKFAELYTPTQHISLDESLLLWKGRLSWKQCIRSKAARFGIKSFELCEATTGYLLQFRLYAGKGTDMQSSVLHGVAGHSAKIVLDLMEGYLNVGHVLVMDNWYNQLSLTRYLKSKRTDVLGTINRRCLGIPSAIKDLVPEKVKRGTCVCRHCGDISLVAWKDVKLVTVVSTYHQHEMVATTRAGKRIMKPEAVQEYNRYMGGVDRKDQKLSMFLLERKRNHKWYMKVFRRLLNTSLLNAFIIYTYSPMYESSSHRDFRWKIVTGLLSSFPPALIPPMALHKPQEQGLPIRLQPGEHFPIDTDYTIVNGKPKLKQLRCVRCYARNKRVMVTLLCGLCRIPLCRNQCWREYHTKVNL